MKGNGDRKWILNPPHKCEKCGKEYGCTNLELMGCEVWQSCDCLPKDKAYFIDTDKMEVVGVIDNIGEVKDEG